MLKGSLADASILEDAFIFAAPGSAGAPAHTVPDAHLLFNAEFERDGNDLKLTGEDGQRFVVHDYFGSKTRAALVSPEGAMLSADVVELLAGAKQGGPYAQATPQATAQTIGQVAKAEGNVTIVRNGVAIAVNSGDGILKGDVVQTGSGGSLGITLSDGSVFSLGPNARMVLNEFVYDPNGSANASLVSLVQGTIDVLSGQVAKTGSMRVSTPAATMGIRGTATHNVVALDGAVRAYVLDQDQSDHLVEIFDLNGVLRTTLSSKGDGILITPLGGAQIALTPLPRTPELKQLEGIILQTLQSLGGQQQQQDPIKTDPDDRTNIQNIQNANGTQFLPSDSSSISITNPNSSFVQNATGAANTNNNTGLPAANVLLFSEVVVPQFVTVVTGPTTAVANVPERNNTTDSSDIDQASGTFPNASGPASVALVSFVLSTGGTTPSQTEALLAGALTTDIVNGVLTWDFALADRWTDFLATDETLTLVYQLTGAFGQRQVTVILTGTNDVPTIHSAVTVDRTEQADQTGSNTPLLEADGTLLFTDVDVSENNHQLGIAVAATGVTTGLALDNAALLALLDTTLNQTGATGIAGSIAWSFSAADQAFDYLARYEKVVLTYTLTITDAQGAIDQQTVTVTITGTNDAPIVAAVDVTGAVTELVTPVGDLTDSGSIAFTDVDLADVHLVSPTGTYIGPDTALGTLTAVMNTDTTGTGLNGQLTWTYTVSAAAMEYLAKDQTKVESFIITLDDQNGSTITRQIDVTITGTNDAPVANGDAFQPVPSGWSLNPSNGHLYKYVSASFITWESAAAAAALASGYLATITSDDENNFIFGLVGGHVAWLGGSDAGDEGQWQWVQGPENGTDFTYTHWDSGEPNDLLNEDFLVTWGSDHSWNDLSSSFFSLFVVDGYVIERDTAGAQYLTALEDTSVTIDVSTLLANDTDIDNPHSALTLMDVTDGSGGHAVLSGDKKTITFTPDPDYNGAASFFYTMSDGHPDGTDTATVSFTVLPVNDAPSQPADSNAVANTIAEGAANGTAVAGLAISSTDVDGGTVTYSLTDNAGGRFAINSSTGAVTVANGSLLNYETATSHTITVKASDASGAFTTQNFAIGVTDVAPSQPADSNAVANTIAEGAANGTAVAGLAISSTDVNGGTVTYSLTDNAGGRFAINSSTGAVTVANGSLLNYETATSHTITVKASDASGAFTTQNFAIGVTDVAPSQPADSNAVANTIAEGAANGTAVAGLAISSTDVNGGTVTYSLTDNAGGRFAINSSTGAVTVANGSLLNYETATSHTITVKASDASGAFTTQNFAIGVTDVAPSQPADSNAVANTIAEGAANGTAVAGLAISSTDVNGGTVTYSLTNNAGGRFAINSSTGAVTVANGSLLNYETATSHTITVRASDGTLNSSTQNFTIGVTDVAPSQPADSNATANTIAEGAANGTAVAGLAISSTDVNGGTVTYSLTDNAGGRFAINSSTGAVTVANGSLLNYETATSHTITVKASDASGAFTTQNFAIGVTDVAPSQPADSNATANTIAEGAANGTAVAGLAISSTDVNGGTVTYSLTDNAGGRFAINSSTGAVTVANGSLLNYETATSHTITVKASDASGAFTTQNFAIGVTDVAPSQPADSNATANTIAEGAANGTAVAGLAISSTDVNGGTVTYSLTDNAGGRFAINSSTGAVTVANGSLLNYETATSHTITVRASDGTLNSSTQNFTINVTDVIEVLTFAPVIIAPDQINYWTNSGSGTVTAINQISFADADAGNDTVTVILSLGQGTLEAASISGDGVGVSGSGTGTVTLTGSIADINAYLADNNVLFNPPGASLTDRTLHVTIDDGGNNGGDAQSASADITLHSVSYQFSNANDVVDLHNVNLDGISSIDMLGGGNVLVTSWNHLDVSATTYDGNDTDDPDTVTLVFSPEQLLEILSDTSSRNEFQSYLDGNPGSGTSADTLNLANSDWNAVVTGFETAWVALAAGNNYVTYSAIGDDLPDYMSGQTGNSGNNTLIASAAGQTLNGNSGNDILVAHSAGSTLNGGTGADLLLGAAGNDTLRGGDNNDILAGNGGADTFVFAPGFGQDIIVDFNNSQNDHIDLQAFTGIDDFDDLQITISNGASVIDLGSGNVITVHNTVDVNNQTTLQANDVLFHA